MTAGERIYLTYGVTGIRGEIENGLPAVVENGLPGLIGGVNFGLSINDALIQSLISLMTVVEDTTILHRHSMSVLKSVQKDAAVIMEHGGMFTETGQELIRKTGSKLHRTKYKPRRVS